MRISASIEYQALIVRSHLGDMSICVCVRSRTRGSLHLRAASATLYICLTDSWRSGGLKVEDKIPRTSVMCHCYRLRQLDLGGHCQLPSGDGELSVFLLQVLFPSSWPSMHSRITGVMQRLADEDRRDAEEAPPHTCNLPRTTILCTNHHTIDESSVSSALVLHWRPYATRRCPSLVWTPFWACRPSSVPPRG